MDRNKLATRQMQKLARKLNLEREVVPKPQRVTPDLIRGLIEMCHAHQRATPRDVAFASFKHYLKKACTIHLKTCVGGGLMKSVTEVSKEYNSYLITFNDYLVEQAKQHNFGGTVVSAQLMAPTEFVAEKDLVIFVERQSLDKISLKVLDEMILKAVRDFVLNGKKLVVMILDPGLRPRIEVSH